MFRILIEQENQTLVGNGRTKLEKDAADIRICFGHVYWQFLVTKINEMMKFNLIFALFEQTCYHEKIGEKGINVKLSLAFLCL